MPRQKKVQLTEEDFIAKCLSRPVVNVFKELFVANEQIAILRKAKTCKEDEVPLSKAELKRLLQIEAKYRKIMDYAKSDINPE